MILAGVLIVYFGISITRSVAATIAWHDKRDCGVRPQARSSRSSSVSSASPSELKPSRTMTWQVVQAQLMSHACSMATPFSSSASHTEVPGAALIVLPSGQSEACGRILMTVILRSR